MWILLVGLASAGESTPDWGVPTRFPEPAPAEEPAAPPPPMPPSAKQVGYGALGTLGVVAVFAGLGLCVPAVAITIEP